MLRAIAVIESHPIMGAAFRILTCPAAREHEGDRFCAGRDFTHRIGDHAVVKFTPDDQFAYEVREALHGNG